MFDLGSYPKDGNTYSVKSGGKGNVAIAYEREILNNQRIGFDLDNTGFWMIGTPFSFSFLLFFCDPKNQNVGGDTQGYLNVWQLWKAAEAKPSHRILHPWAFEKNSTIKGSKKGVSVNNAIFHPTKPYFVTTCGERVYKRRGKVIAKKKVKEKGKEKEKESGDGIAAKPRIKPEKMEVDDEDDVSDDSSASSSDDEEEVGMSLYERNVNDILLWKC